MPQLEMKFSDLVLEKYCGLIIYLIGLAWGLALRFFLALSRSFFPFGDKQVIFEKFGMFLHLDITEIFVCILVPGEQIGLSGQ